MQIIKSEFITSAVEPSQYPDGALPYVALVGKSNVGKSSMINTVTNRSKLARTSVQPGKTRLVNFYKINDIFYFVDLPGYGYAKVSREEKNKWGVMIETFLSTTKNLVGIIQLVDIRHKPTEDDLQMMKWIQHFNIPLAVVATKADKIGKTRWKPQINNIKTHLRISHDVPVIAFSSQNRIGIDQVLDYLDCLISNHLPHLQD